MINYDRNAVESAKRKVVTEKRKSRLKKTLVFLFLVAVILYFI